MLMIGIPVVSTLVKFNLGALLHSIGERLPSECIPDNQGACSATEYDDIKQAVPLSQNDVLSLLQALSSFQIY
ncbi:hypothetical protein DSO57_1011148 [Entomophthora muscae]|uniref:Uncharacterized protein n=1 Tax=Entomophthora muscae TaxID=34485 RepID=A0ACC2SVE6_9FUNG|nr:hypothetical protein DSO57_1011148 [Entomophthora muscae]